MNFETYRRRLTHAGSARRERVIEAAKRDAMQKAVDSPAYKEVDIEGVKRHMMVISTSLTSQKIIQAMPGDDFDIGKILVWNHSHWLITERDSDDEITVRGRIELCNREVVWQNEDGEIISRWATVDKPYFSNLQENKVMSISSREFMVQMPYDAQSAKLDIGKRLMLEAINGEPKTYRITCVDTMTERYDRSDAQTGFLVINVEQDQYDAGTDNAALMLCDYKQPTQKSEEVPAEIRWKGKLKARVGGLGKTLFYRQNGEEYPTVVWTIRHESDITKGKVCFANGKDDFVGARCRVTAQNDLKLVGQWVTVVARADNTAAVAQRIEVVAR